MHRIPLAVWLCALLLCAPGAATAQAGDPEPPTPAASSSPALQKTLARLDARIAEAEADLARGREARAAARAAALAERRELAQEIVALEIDTRRLAAEERTVAASAASALAESDRLLHASDALLRSTTRLAEQLSLYLRELPVPPTDARALTQRALAPREEHPPTPPTGSGAAGGGITDRASRRAAKIARQLPAVGQALRAFLAVRKSAGRVISRPGSIRSPNGKPVDATLVSVGHVGALARTADGDVYVALRAPLEASGYRWRPPGGEARLTAVQAMKRLSFEGSATTAASAVAASAAAPVLVPLDVTGRLRASALAAPMSVRERLEQGGPVMVPLLLVALAALGIALERAWFFLREQRRSRNVAGAVFSLVRDEDHEGALRACERTDCVLGRVLAAALERPGAEPDAVLEAVEERLLHEEPRVERRLRALSLLGSIAPLLGLLGTVTGIIRTFGVLSGGSAGRSALLAGGVSEALVTTAAGLAIAIPVLLVHGLLRGRADALVADAERHVASLLRLLRERRPSDGSGHGAPAPSLPPSPSPVAEDRAPGAPAR